VKYGKTVRLILGHRDAYAILKTQTVCQRAFLAISIDQLKNSIKIAIFMAIFIAIMFQTGRAKMKSANIADIKNNLSRYIALVEQGEVVEICKRNVPVARVVPTSPSKRNNQTRLGCGRETGRIVGDVTEPALPAEAWDMLGE